jgi:hypothetical protein
MLLELEKRQIEEIHRLVKAWIHPHLLPLGDLECLS